MNSLRVALVGESASAPAALVAGGHCVVPLAIDAGDIAGAVAALRSCSVVLPMVDGSDSHRLAALCELAGVACVGSPQRARAMDAWTTRLVAQAIGVDTPSGVLVTRGEARHAAAMFATDLPMVVRPVAGRSPGSVVHTRDELTAALDAALAGQDRVLVDDVVAGHATDVAVLGLRDGSRQVATCGPADPRALRAAVAMYDAAGCAGAARFGFLIAENGPVLTEVDATPGLAEECAVPRLFAAVGVGYPELLDRLVRDAVPELRVAVAAR